MDIEKNWKNFEVVVYKQGSEVLVMQNQIKTGFLFDL